ncbi:beta-galactosidase [Fundicoccus sp. Sow4_D5]|uniref:beta-galactosidase n=1 Tax=unclassified Fundicoccus TaxID=2761543 RepID=UPI003F8F2EC9
MTKQLFDRMIFGGDYNPGQWPREVWDEDMRMFKKAHINSATVNVFSWAKLQPSEAVYDFSELDDIMAMLEKENYDIVLGTSTAAMPAWMSRKYPDVNRTDFYGREHKYGHRHNHCPNSPTFQKYAERLVSKIAERYGDSPHLKVWHISNEYNTECYCDNCAKEFRVWLQEKYETIEAVNEAWNMDFWSHTLYDFDDIVPPNYLGDGISDTMTAFAGLAVDYKRFQSDSLLNNFIMEREAIRRYDKETPVTTNMMGAYKGLDYFKWAKEMDIVSWDSYPSYEPDWAHVSMMHDLMRGVKDGQSFMLMEQTPSQQNWQPYNSLKAPGRMRVQSYHTIAHGADSVQYFQLRRSKGGCEKFHGAVIEHVGHEDTRVFREVAQLGQELEALGDQLIGARSDSKVGILFDWDNYWAFEFTSGPNVDLYYVNQVQHYYNALYKKQVQVDILHMDSDFSNYDVILAPVLYMVKEGVAEKLEKFVEAGGSFLTTFMSGIVDQSDNVHLGGYPGPLRKLLGLWVEEIDALAPNAANAITSASDAIQSADYKGSLVSDLIHLEGAESLANYDSNWYAGMPAVTKHHFGKGTAYYIGTQADDDLTAHVVQLLLNDQNIATLEDVPEGVEVTARRKDGTEFVFIMNHNDTAISTNLAYEGYTDLLTGEQLTNDLELKGFDVKIAVKDK